MVSVEHKPSIVDWDSVFGWGDEKFRPGILFQHINIRWSEKNPKERQLEVELVPQPDFVITDPPLITHLYHKDVHGMREGQQLSYKTDGTKARPSEGKRYYFYLGDQLDPLEMARNFRLVLRAHYKEKRGQAFDLLDSKIDFRPALELLSFFREMKNFLDTHTLDPFQPHSSKQELIIQEYFQMIDRFIKSLHRSVGEELAHKIEIQVDKDFFTSVALQHRIPSPEETFIQQSRKLSAFFEKVPGEVDFLGTYQDVLEIAKKMRDCLEEWIYAYQKEKKGLDELAQGKELHDAFFGYFQSSRNIGGNPEPHLERILNLATSLLALISSRVPEYHIDQIKVRVAEFSHKKRPGEEGYIEQKQYATSIFTRTQRELNDLALFYHPSYAFQEHQNFARLYEELAGTIARAEELLKTFQQFSPERLERTEALSAD